jgi:hypothetical protein
MALIKAGDEARPSVPGTDCEDLGARWFDEVSILIEPQQVEPGGLDEPAFICLLFAPQCHLPVTVSEIQEGHIGIANICAIISQLGAPQQVQPMLPSIVKVHRMAIEHPRPIRPNLK